jgi:hypothetical protein
MLECGKRALEWYLGHGVRVCFLMWALAGHPRHRGYSEAWVEERWGTLCWSVLGSLVLGSFEGR